MAYTGDLLDGLAQLLAAAGLGVYRPDGVYAAGETGIFFTAMPEAPDGVLCLSAYPVEDTDLTDAITGVQVRMRAGLDPRALDALADSVFDLLHNRQDFYCNAVRVAVIWRQSQALMGQDVHGRMELSANYYARTTRPASHVID